MTPFRKKSRSMETALHITTAVIKYVLSLNDKRMINEDGKRNPRRLRIVSLIAALAVIVIGATFYTLIIPSYSLLNLAGSDDSSQLPTSPSFSTEFKTLFSSSSLDQQQQPQQDATVRAPAFTLPSTIGRNISLSDYSDRKNVLLYFQEGIMCAPCWEQIEDIQKEYDKFESLDMEVITITVDPLNALIKESTTRGITLPVLEDEDLSVSKAYDVLDHSMHPGSRPGHSFILIGKDGNIVWKKDYYPAGTNIGGMNMSPDGRMYVPVGELLEEIYKVAYRLFPEASTVKSKGNNVSSDYYKNQTLSMTQGDNRAGDIEDGLVTMTDHSMCLTPIHKHADFKVYLNGLPLDLAQRKYMDQASDVHFHPTVKVNPDDIPGVPFADIVHIHRENITISDFLNTLDFDNATSKILRDNSQMLKVYANGDLRQEGLNYVIQDKDRLLVSYNATESQIDGQIKSVSNYTTLGKDKNPSLFGGC